MIGVTPPNAMTAPVPIVAGHRADCVLFNPAATTTFSRSNMKSQSSNTPFLDRTLEGAVEMVVVGNAVLKG